MTTVDFARNLARSDDPHARSLGVAIIARGLSDDDPADPYRQGWPLDRHTIEAAARYLDLTPTDALCADALALAPTLSDAILNRRTVA